MSDWEREPLGIRAMFRHNVRRYRIMPMTHATMSFFGAIFPLNLQTSLSKHWLRPIVGVSRRGSQSLRDFAIAWQSAGFWKDP